MPRYTVECKEKVVQKMMPPNAQSLSAIQRETGISLPMLIAWRKEEFAQKGRAGAGGPRNPSTEGYCGLYSGISYPFLKYGVCHVHDHHSSAG